MTEDQMDQWIKEQYGSLSMSESRMQTILKRTEEIKTSTSQAKMLPFYQRGWFSYAAAACIALMIVSVVVVQTTRRIDTGQPTDIANQVIGLYAMHLEPDVYSADLSSIQAGLNHSDFSIIPTNMEPIRNYQVRGGRSCGMKGLKAVHVVLVNKQSKQESCLYVLPDVEEFQRFQDALVRVGDEKVSFWHDNGRFFALYDPSGK